MPKITLSDLTNVLSSTAITTIEANNDAIETAFDNTLSLDGSAPNSMAAQLDMNSNKIINLPAASTVTEPVRKNEFDNAVLAFQANSLVPPMVIKNLTHGGNIQVGIPSGNLISFVDGGQLSGATPILTNTPSVLISRYESVTGGGDGSGGAALNVVTAGIGPTQSVAVSATAYSVGAQDVVALYGFANKHPSGSTGASFGLFSQARTERTDASAIGANIATQNFASRDYPYSANMLGVDAILGVDISYGSLTVNKASAAIFIRGDLGNGAGWDVGIGFQNFAGFSSTKTADIQTDTSATHILYAPSGAHTNGINLAGATFSGNAFASPGFTVTGTGLVTLNLNTGATVAVPSGTGLQLVAADGTINSITLDSFGQPNTINGRRAEGTRTAKTASIADANSLSLAAYGWDTANYVVGAQLQLRTAETWSATNHGTYIRIATCPLGSITVAEAARFQGSGGLSVGTATDGGIGSILASTTIKSQGATNGIGYATGAGGTVTQATSKSTGVTLNKVSGQITLNNAALATNTTVSFVVTNSAVATTDVIIVNHASAGTAGAYLVEANAIGAGSFSISVRNITGGSLSEAIVLNFAVIKAVAA